MFNLRVSSIAAGAAFILSFLIGLVSQASMPMLILRPALFAAIFFVVSAAIHIMISHFLPELLEKGALDDADLLPGSRINILEGDSAEAPQGYSLGASGKPFMGAQPDESEGELGDVSDLLKNGRPSVLSDEGTQAGMDQNTQDGYTGAGEIGNSPKPGSSGDFGNLLDVSSSSSPAGDSGAAGSASSVDVLPDLDSMAGAFLPASMDGGSDTADSSVSGPSLKRAPPGGKAAAWAGDFNAKDMAAGLRTVLSKEKEG